MTATSFLVPAAGVITAPILAQGLGAEGRGILAAALAPSALMLNLATLGLPDALTYHLARWPSVTRRVTAWASLATILLGVLSVGATALLLPVLSADDSELSRLILIASASTIPALVVGVLRGAAVGRQLWKYIAIERVILTLGRVVLFGALFWTGTLTVFTAVIVNVALPVAAGVVYVVVTRRPPADMDKPGLESTSARPVFAYGLRVWWGSVASMTLSRLAPLIMVPLSTAYDLGLYTVATTISDLPLIVALAVQGALFGVGSRDRNAARVTDTARLTALLAIAGSTAIALTLPWWLVPLFGADFSGALGPTILLLASACLCVPGLMAAGGLSSFGRPELRSAGLLLTLIVYLLAFVLLVPLYGVWGAAWTSVIGNIVMSSFMIAKASRVLEVSPWRFVAITWADVRRTWDLGMQSARVVLRRLGR